LATGPAGAIAQTYLKIMNKIAEQFGLTPSSRSRIIAGAENNGKGIDRWKICWEVDEG
jgi:P27 family predicted phage terminase small subunit